MNCTNKFGIGDEVPQTLEDENADELARSEKAASYSIVGASVRGRLHHHNNTKRDDAFVVRFDGTWLAVAVADGAGSRSRSRYGASYLANRLCKILLLATRTRTRGKKNKASHITSNSETNETLKNNLQDIVLKAFKNTRADLTRFAVRHGVGLDELHSTLLGLILNTKTGNMGVGQIGDGLILGLDNKSEPEVLAEPPATNDPGASYFITQEDWDHYLFTREMSGEQTQCFSTFYLMTDGVANDCQYGPPPDILKKWAIDMNREIRLFPSLNMTAERLKNYLANYKTKGSFDDRTLVVIFKNGEVRAT